MNIKNNMNSFEYFTFDVTHKYINGKKSNNINYQEGFYITGIAKDYRRYSLKKINRDIEIFKNTNNIETNIKNNILKTDIKKSYILRKRESVC